MYISYEYYRIFYHVARCGNLTKAAEALQNSQPNLTRAIRNLEAEIGIGYAYTGFDQYRCAGCGKKLTEDNRHHYFGPTKAAVNLVYVF